VKRFIRSGFARLYIHGHGHGDTRRCEPTQESVMKKFMLALFVAAGLGTAGVSIATSFSPAEAACHNQSTSRYYNGRC
jgi:hypothetical protein